MALLCREQLGSRDKRRVSINILPDDVLLLVFLSHRATYLDRRDNDDRLSPFWRWDRLVHVCRRWRSLCFASPKFLDLKLVCTPRTRMELTGIWPSLPITISEKLGRPMPNDYDFDALTVHHNRICEINFFLRSDSLLQRLASAMQEHFPALIHLKLKFKFFCFAPALPDRFLVGSAPRLQSLELQSIPFPALPKLLLSANNLVHLTLREIPSSGYISPEAMVIGLAVLLNLKYLTIGFEYSLPRPDGEIQRSLPPTPAVLPALIRFEFNGVSEYLEEFVARIDAPLLDSISITFYHQLIFDIPQLAQFMRRTTRLLPLNEAHVIFGHRGIHVESLPSTQSVIEKSLRISCKNLEWNLSYLVQTFTSLFPSIYTVEHLYLYRPQYLRSDWQHDLEDVQWLEVFRTFASVKNLYVSKEFALCIASALQELVRERVTDVLPSLECLFLEDPRPSRPVTEAIEQFAADRKLLGHPVAVSRWNGSTEVLFH